MLAHALCSCDYLRPVMSCISCYAQVNGKVTPIAEDCYSKVDSKVKAALTRAYNKESHCVKFIKPKMVCVQP